MERPKKVKVICSYSRKDFEEALNNLYRDNEVLELQYQPMGTSYTAVVIYTEKPWQPEREKEELPKKGSFDEMFEDAAERAAEYNSKLDLEKELGNELVHE